MPQTTGTPTYVVAAVHQWNREVFDQKIKPSPGLWHFVDRQENLTSEWLESVSPRYVFFLHWSWKVPAAITDRFECVAFHMTDVPYGRGGSPLQNLILRGHTQTKLTALKMEQEFDAGPVYLKSDLSLVGPAHAIYRRASETAAEMIGMIAREQPQPQHQTGEPVYFKRRSPQESALPVSAAPAALYDFIRMLDADGYPRAFLEVGTSRLEFSDAHLAGNEVTARVRIIPKEPDTK